MPRPSQRPYLRPWPRWIALWAFALAALAPTVSRTLALAGQPGWVEVCTAAGVRWLRLADGAAAGEPAAQHVVTDDGIGAVVQLGVVQVRRGGQEMVGVHQ